MKKKQKIIAIVGATATGKTKLSLQLAHELNGEIISADSRMVYKYFDIGTAKPTFDEREGIPHYLIDILEPEENFSVAEFIDTTKELLKDFEKREKQPIIVGGTGLYFKVLLDNYNLPRVAANIELRNELENIAKMSGVEKVHEILQNLDYKTSQKVHKNNIVRVIRSIEIITAFKKPLDEIVTKNDSSEYEIEWIGLNFNDRSKLYDRINARVDLMLKNGLVDEVMDLYKKYGKIKSLMNTIGYAELIDYLDRKIDLQTAVELIKQHTRNYAKRQLSLFKVNDAIQWRYIDAN